MTDPIDYAHQFIDHGIPIVVCTPRHGWDPVRDKDKSDVIPPVGWARITPEESRDALTAYRPGIDTLALVGGWGIDVVDLDTKAGAQRGNVPPVRTYGEHETPSGGAHLLIRSTGYAKKSPFSIGGLFIGDYVGGTKAGGGRMLAFLPGSNRPKYPSHDYQVATPIDWDTWADDEPDEDFAGLLEVNGLSSTATAAESAVGVEEVNAWAAQHLQAHPVPCEFGANVLAKILTEAGDTVKGDDKQGRHGWIARSTNRVVELVLDGCLPSTALKQLQAQANEIKAGSRQEFIDCLRWAIANMEPGKSGCSVHTNNVLQAWGLEQLAGKPADAAHDGGEQPAPEPTPVAVATSGHEIDQQREGHETPTANGQQERPLGLADSQDGHAELLLRSVGGTLRYCPERGLWLAWTGWRWEWQPASGGTARERAKAIARGYPDRDPRWQKFKRSALSTSGLAGCLAVAQTDDRVVTHINDLDAAAWELCTPGGVVDLRTGILHPPTPSHLHTKSTTCAPDPAADPTAWAEFLLDVFQGDLELISYVQRLFGVATVGQILEQIVVVLYGSGQNGKSVFLEVLQGILGDYAAPTPEKFLVESKWPQHPTEIAGLVGIRLATAIETDEGHAWSEARMKQLSGGDMLTARYMRGDFFKFQPSATLFLATNSRLTVKTGGDAFWRRIREIPFNWRVPEDKVDKELAKRLVADHGPAILHWLVTGARQYAEHGLGTAAAVTQATKEYQDESDTVASFARARLLIGGGEHIRIRSTELTSAYDEFVSAEYGEDHPRKKAKAFRAALTKLGLGYGQDKRGSYYSGATLLNQSEDDE